MENSNSDQTPVNRTTITRCINDNKLVTQGYVIKFSDAIKVLCPNRTRQIDIFATSKVLIDTDFVANDNCQLNIVAPTWEIIGSPKFILDGKDGESHSSQKAKDGESGLPGLPGGAAGNFYGVGKNFINGQNLTISANGGAGGPGQDGGNGMAGKPGEDADPNLILETEHHRKFAGKESQTYVVQGIPGRRGGSGGDGGKGGLGGPGGEIRILNLGEAKNHGINVFNEDGKNGANGMEGLAGPGGKNGKDCRVVVSGKFAVWLEFHKNKNVTCFETNVIAPAGNDGRPGANQNGQRLNFGNIFQPFSEVMLDYKMFALENLPESQEFLRVLAKQCNPSHLVQELQRLEKEEIPKSVYEFLLDQFYWFIEDRDSKIDEDVLTQMYFAIKSKLKLLEQRNLSYFIFDTGEYLEEVIKRLRSLRNSEKRPSRNLWVNDNDRFGLMKVKEDINRTEYTNLFARFYIRMLLNIDSHTMKPLLEIGKFQSTIKVMHQQVEGVSRDKVPSFVEFFRDSPNWISLVKFNRWLENRYNADAYQRIQIFEDHMMLGQMLLKNSEISKITKANMILHQYQMAERALKQARFPFFSVFSKKEDLPSLQNRDNLDRLILNSIKRIEKMIPFYKLNYTYQELNSENNSIYIWNREKWGKQINELLSGKEVFLTADVDDDQNIKLETQLIGIKLKEIKIKFVTSNKNQEQLDRMLKNIKVRMTHVGDSYYRCGNHSYVIRGDEQVIEFGYGHSYENEVSKKLRESTPFLSPYTVWGVKLLAKPISYFKRLKEFENHVTVSLVGKILGFDKNIEQCHDENSKILKKHLTVVTNSDKFEKSFRRREKRNTITDTDNHAIRRRANVNYEVANDLMIGSNKWKEADKAIGHKNFGPEQTFFDLNANLMLGQFMMSKILGRTFQSRSYLSPEQERLIKIKELEEQILPFLK